MKMMDELKPLFLYSSNKKVYAPIDETDKKHNSAILLLTPNIDVTSTIMKLPYIYNPNLFISFYIDRQVMPYITGNIEDEDDDIEFNELEEESISEAMLRNWNNKTAIVYGDSVTTMDKRYISESITPQACNYFVKHLQLTFTPKRIKIITHPDIKSLCEDAPNDVKKLYKGKVYSYSNGEELHILNKSVYNNFVINCKYNTYLVNELIINIISQATTDLPTTAIHGIAYSLSGMITDNINDDDLKNKNVINFAKTISSIIEDDNFNTVRSYIKTGDIRILSKYASSKILRMLKKVIFESELSYTDRQKLLPSEFGVPNKRKYPIHNEEYVKLAIKMFNSCDPSDEEELAENIIKKIKKFGITDVKVSAVNRFKKYYTPSKNINESAVATSEFDDILKICDNLSPDELKQITFYDTYKDSKFVIKRIIHRIDGEPVGFLDVYHFPSKPDIAQITIAVDNRFRDRGISDKMVKELMNSDIHKTYNFRMYYWTAYPYNEASKNLALKNGFVRTNKDDEYGRAVFIKKLINSNKPIVKPDDLSMLESCYSFDDAILEADNSSMYNQTFKRYLYSERLKTNKDTLLYYDKIKAENPFIKKTYIKLNMYNKFNLFVDLSYYHSLFIKNNTFKLDKGINFYFEFLNRLINNKKISDLYKKETIFIPLYAGVWNIQPDSEIYDYRRNINPISVIFRLIKSNSTLLKNTWGNKNIIFVSPKGYFKVDFKSFKPANLVKFKSNIKKMLSNDNIIDEDNDEDLSVPNGDTDSKKVLTAKIIGDIETGTNISIDNIKPSSTVSDTEEPSIHLKINSTPVILDKNKTSVAIVNIDPDGIDSLDRLNKTPLASIGKISTCCIIDN